MTDKCSNKRQTRTKEKVMDGLVLLFEPDSKEFRTASLVSSLRLICWSVKGQMCHSLPLFGYICYNTEISIKRFNTYTGSEEGTKEQLCVSRWHPVDFENPNWPPVVNTWTFDGEDENKCQFVFQYCHVDQSQRKFNCQHHRDCPK